MSYAYMKALESAPERYERGMRILTMGRLDRLYETVVARIGKDERVLDLGCGTGALAVRLAGAGAVVTGVDVCRGMLRQARASAQGRGLKGRIVFLEMGAADLDGSFSAGSFDVVVSTLLFSELSSDEVRHALGQCHRVLVHSGRLLVADEVLPESALGRIAGGLVRLPFSVAAYLLTQTTTHRVARMAEKIEQASFRVVETEDYLAGTLKLFSATRLSR